MKQKILSLLRLALWLCAIAPGAISAQECGTKNYLDYLETRYPELKKQRDAVQAQAKTENVSALFADALITIPVVVHIVFNNAAENIPDQQVYDQMEVLNEDFRHLNQDITVAPDVFRSISADIGIQFCLANTDPDGNPTSGITRTSTWHGQFLYPDDASITDDVKYTANGGIDAWDHDHYLNIWVCDINAGIRGYSPYPGNSPAAEDGIVVDFMNFGSVTSSRGRTVPHETGHWLNLIHIWGDADCGDDQVADTPVAKQSNSGCSDFPHNSTDCNTSTNGEMFVNHMDYSDHTCRVMFTQGQRDRMLANFVPIIGARRSLVSSGGCGSNCPRAQFVTSNFNGDNLTFEASDFVIGWSNIVGGSNIVYSAGDSVRMDPGFHVTPGNEFRAFIGGCTGSRSADRRVLPIGALNPDDKLACAPNPFSESANVLLTLGSAATVSVAVYDLNGRQLALLANNADLEKGVHVFPITQAHNFPPGIYFVKAQSGNGLLLTQKIVIQ